MEGLLGVWEQYGRSQFLLEFSSQSGRDIEDLMDVVFEIERCLESRMNRMRRQIGCGSQRSQRKKMSQDYFGSGLLESVMFQRMGNAGVE